MIGGYPAGLMQPGFQTASNDSMLRSVWSVSTSTLWWFSERRIDFPREGLILREKDWLGTCWKRIGRSCLSLLQTKTVSNINENSDCFVHWMVVCVYSHFCVGPSFMVLKEQQLHFLYWSHGSISYRTASWFSRHNLYRFTDVKRCPTKFSKCFNLKQPALQLTEWP